MLFQVGQEDIVMHFLLIMSCIRFVETDPQSFANLYRV